MSHSEHSVLYNFLNSESILHYCMWFGLIKFNMKVPTSSSSVVPSFQCSGVISSVGETMVWKNVFEITWIFSFPHFCLQIWSLTRFSGTYCINHRGNAKLHKKGQTISALDSLNTINQEWPRATSELYVKIPTIVFWTIQSYRKDFSSAYQDTYRQLSGVKREVIFNQTEPGWGLTRRGSWTHGLSLLSQLRFIVRNVSTLHQPPPATRRATLPQWPTYRQARRRPTAQPSPWLPPSFPPQLPYCLTDVIAVFFLPPANKESPVDPEAQNPNWANGGVSKLPPPLSKWVAVFYVCCLG